MNARDVGAHLQNLLRGLEHPFIADVRGFGLFCGMEFADQGVPQTGFCGRVVEAMKDEGVLLGRVGRAQHILKMRPPMPFSRENAALLVQTLDRVLKRMPS